LTFENAMTEVHTEGRLPIVIGVAGHRDIDPADWPVYRRRVTELFAELRRRYPATPLRVMSALAEGADRLVAHEALAQACELIVPLPMHQAEYERDFTESIADFRAIVSRVPRENVFVAPSVPECDPLRSHDPAGGRSQISERDRRYEASGAFVARHCHFLIAIWDGVFGDSAVGTAAVVRLKLQGGSAPGGTQPRALDAQDSGPVFHVRARRRGIAQDQFGEIRWIYPEESGTELFSLIFARIDRFNNDAGRSRVVKRTAAAAAGLLPELASRPGIDRSLATAFAFADQLAVRYRRMTQSVLRSVLLMAAGLALTYEVYAEVLPLRVVPIAYLTIFAAITLIYFWQRRVDAQGRYLDYRAVAEGLRVQFYWRISGLKEDVCANYLRKQLDELRWIREALRGASSVPPVTAAPLGPVLRHWIRGQSEYYRVRARHQERRLHRIDRLSGAFLAAGLLATAALVVLWRPLERLETLHHWIVLLMGFAPIAAALWEAYGEKAGLRTQANQYARFAAVFRRAESHAEALETYQDPAARHAAELDLIRELGRESLMENGDWVLLLRERPIVLPKG
jgi:hypothetical protein